MEPSSLRCGIPADWNSNFSRCLYDWQGLEAGALALVAAIISVIVLRRQIKQQQTHRADEISRAHVAARVKLPLALAATSELVAIIANEVSDEFESYDPNGNRTIAAVLGSEPARDRFKPVSMPNEVLASFADFVASHGNASDVRHVAELVASIQILLSRYNGFDLNQPAAQHSLGSLLIDVGKVKLLNEKIYNYARFVDDSPFGIVGVLEENAVWDEIHGQAQSLVFTRQSPDAFFPEFQRRIDGHKERNTSPWNEKFGD